MSRESLVLNEAFQERMSCDEINELIGLYEAHPSMWDVSINKYKN